jgi:small subunit ribosomal protein S13
MVFLDKNSNKKVYQVLNEILGLGHFNTKLLCKKFGFQQKCTLKDLDSFELEQLKNYLMSNFTLDKLLIENTNKDVKKKIDLGTYEGKRHNLGYPVRGQRTLSNAKTQRNLYKLRFHSDSDSVSHVYFKNKQQSLKNKKIKQMRVLNKPQNNFKYYGVNTPSINTNINKKNLVKKPKKSENISYLKKLEKIKVERKLQIERKFKKDHQQAMKNHPYFLNIEKSKAKKTQKKNQNPKNAS